MKKLKVATMFSGGLAAPEFALKYENISHETIFACEIDKFARAQYLKFHGMPEAFYRDINDIDGNKYKNEIDLLAWGSPCQDVSIAGVRKGFNGDRSSLFRIGAKVQLEIKPKNFIFENVLGLLSSNNGRDYKEVLRTFREQGYYIATLKLNTKDYNIPQNRDRVFIVGFLDIDEYFSFREPKPTELKLKLKDLLQKWVEPKYFLSQKIIDGFMNSSFAQRRNLLQETDVCSALTASEYKEPKCVKMGLVQVGNINQNGHNSIWGRVYSVNGLASALNANGGGVGAKTGLYIIPHGKNKGGYRDANILPTITSSAFQDNCLLSDSFSIRKLTPFECFRLQGLKDKDIKLVNSNTQSYKIVGNAMSVNVLQEIVRALYNKSTTKENLFDFID